MDAAREGDVDKWPPLRALRLAQQLHSRLVRKAVSFARVARDAGTDDVLPCCLAAAVARKHVIKIEVGTVENLSAILAGVFIPLEDIEAREFDLLFRQPLEEAENDDAGNPDAEFDRLKHPGLGIHRRKIPPARKIMRHVPAWPVGGHDLGMTLVEKGESSACRTGVDGLPQPVEYEDRLIEQSVHDLVV